MSIEHIDVQWTLICDCPANDALTRAENHSTEDGLRLNVEARDPDGNLLPSDEPWPSETTGVGRYSGAKGDGQRTLFRSTYSDGTLTKITGGLYLHEFTDGSTAVVEACERGFADLRHLFRQTDAVCLVPTLEDDDGIDVSPSIVGIYRADVWDSLSSTARQAVFAQSEGDWVIVRPVLDRSVLQSVSSMPEGVQRSMQAIQQELERSFWRTQTST